MTNPKNQGVQTSAPRKCFTDRTDTVVAASLEEAIAFVKHEQGLGEFDLNPDNWRELLPEESLSIIMEEDHTSPITRTVAEWIAQSPAGPSFLCSTEY